MHWDKELAIWLRGLGVSQEHIGPIIGQVAEHRQQADLEGFARGYNAGFADANERLNENQNRPASNI